MAKPAAGATLNTGHADAANLITCLPFLEGTGNPSDLIRTTDYVLGTGLTWATSGFAQYDPCLRSGAASTALMFTSASTPPMNARSGPWAILLGIRRSTTGETARYFYVEGVGNGDGFAIVDGFVNDTFELYVPGATTGDFRTGSGITVSDTNWHVIGWSYAGAAGEYAKWLDGVKTPISASTTLVVTSGLTKTHILGRDGDGAWQSGDQSFLYEWSSVPNLAAISADPWAMFAATVAGPASIYQLFEA